jgi:UDP-glucose 4-epimerase
MKIYTATWPRRYRWLVTGGRGFLGSEVCHKLNSMQVEVISVDRKPAQPHLSWEQVVMEITSTNVSQLEKFQFDGIVHLAALKSVQESVLFPEMYHSNNVELSEALLAMSIEKKIPSFIFVSSASVYKSSETEISEESDLEPLSPYGQSKLDFENRLLSAEAVTPQNRVIVRPFNIVGCNFLGQYSNSVVTKILKSINYGISFNHNSRISQIDNSHMSPVRDYIDVSDVAEIISKIVSKCQVTMLDSKLTVNACTGIGHSVEEVIRKAELCSGKILERSVMELDPKEILVSIGSPALLRKTLEFNKFCELEQSIANEWRVIIREK